ncbi:MULTISPECIES: phospholipid scramblase-related protein [Pseudofrankia]|uniref:phospholipid scramblase-related protein n=1 Tax=Pseudofrankia TaxID=2994363 RepID=UPI00047F65B7|nr:MULTISPECIES: phospholipid scramblase-related protein [Pseudofrankia]OHV39901.1 Scramblase [Pseudofrankia sp. EUN1h]
MSQNSPTPGWYQDPSGAPGLRWWDGTQWTTHTQQAPQGQPTPPPQAQPQPAQQAPVAQPAGPYAPQAQPQQPGGYPQGPGQPGPGWQQGPGQPGPGYPQGPGQPMQWGAAQGGPGAPGGYAPAPVFTSATPDKIQHQVQQQAGVGPVGPGGGSIFSEPVLVVNQKTQLIEVTNQYAVFDQQGRQIASVVEVGQSTVKKVARVLTSLDQYMTHTLEVRDPAGMVQLVLTRPRKLVKSRVVVTRPDGAEIGQIVQQNAIGKIRFGLMVGEHQVGMIKAENWRAWNFAIVDHNDVEVARITKTWEGVLRTMFTTADNYVVQIHHRLADPLMSLVVASALTVDTALKQDSRGWN